MPTPTTGNQGSERPIAASSSGREGSGILVKNVTESATQQLLLQKGDIDIARNLTGDQLAESWLAPGPERRDQRGVGQRLKGPHRLEPNLCMNMCSR